MHGCRVHQGPTHWRTSIRLRTGRSMSVERRAAGIVNSSARPTRHSATASKLWRGLRSSNIVGESYRRFKTTQPCSLEG